jgi:hypothetical protein
MSEWWFVDRATELEGDRQERCARPDSIATDRTGRTRFTCLKHASSRAAAGRWTGEAEVHFPGRGVAALPDVRVVTVSSEWAAILCARCSAVHALAAAPANLTAAAVQRREGRAERRVTNGCAVSAGCALRGPSATVPCGCAHRPSGLHPRPPPARSVFRRHAGRLARGAVADDAGRPSHLAVHAAAAHQRRPVSRGADGRHRPRAAERHAVHACLVVVRQFLWPRDGGRPWPGWSRRRARRRQWQPRPRGSCGRRGGERPQPGPRHDAAGAGRVRPGADGLLPHWRRRRREWRWHGVSGPRGDDDATLGHAGACGARDEDRPLARRRIDARESGTTTPHPSPLPRTTLPVHAHNVSPPPRARPSPLQRVRTVQRFDDRGRLSCVYLMTEERVIDAVTGAVDRYGGRRAATASASSSAATRAHAGATSSSTGVQHHQPNGVAAGARRRAASSGVTA